jgi:phosphohistidine swiveling domain-containing protein
VAVGVTVEYQCADGTPFPVTFGSEQDAEKTWQLEQAHAVGPMSPLARAVARVGTAGDVRAYVEVGLPEPTWWWAPVEANGWPYFSVGAMDDDVITALFAGCGALVERFGSAYGIWTDDSLPKVRATCEWLQSAPDVPFAQLAEAACYSQSVTMISAYVASNDVRLLADAVRALVDDPELVANELAQGHESETLRANRALYDGDVDAFLESEYGWRAELWNIDSPAWRERGPGFTAMLEACRAGEPPAMTLAGATARREQLCAELVTRFDDENQRARFLRRVQRLSTYVPVREDRAMWQLITYGSLRHAVLAHAARIGLDPVEDVLFLTPEEYDDPSLVDRDALAARRAEHERWSSVTPPTFVGAVPEPAAAGALRGTGVSRGRARGVARVVLDLADAARLGDGDILVCPTTSPPWTPLFAIAGALVTDTGDLGSHAAISAREYGLPCVVGVDGATRRIPDGALVEVDGAAGTVEIV